MNYCYFIMLLFLLFGISNAQIPEDKLKHLGAGVVIGGVSGFAANQLFNGDRYWTWSASLGGSLAAGIAKESYDISKGGIWDHGDILYTVIGGAFSGLVFELFVNKSKCRRSGRPCRYNALQINEVQKNALDRPLVIQLSENASGSLTAHIQAQAILSVIHKHSK